VTVNDLKMFISINGLEVIKTCREVIGAKGQG